MTLSPEIARAMNLPENQQGVLVEEIMGGSPADKAGLHGSYKPVTIQGEQLLVGGDTIVAWDGRPVTQMEELIREAIMCACSKFAAEMQYQPASR